MSAFYVGQRVRIARVVTAWEAIGLEGTVISPLLEGCCLLSGRYVGHEVSVDGIGCRSPGGYRYVFRPENLEPILPEGLESNEEIDALYEPSPCEAFENIGMRRESGA